jgi:hypothetical protein
MVVGGPTVGLIDTVFAVVGVTVALSIPLHNKPGASKSNKSTARLRTGLIAFAESREMESNVSDRSR